jgi:hypothetical protein
MSNLCTHCEEPVFDDGDRFVFANGPVAHRSCFIRTIVGSVAHQLKTCSCYVPGSTEGDADGLTRREAADAAARLFKHLSGVKEQ